MSDFQNDERARHANSLLQNELYKEAFEVLEKDLMSRWVHSGSTESEARESIWLAMRLLDRIQIHLQSIIETGRMDETLKKQHPFI
jgi:phosphomevalonate kinase|tara:strand:- start:136 stop:393 length:258 start_codon:yes stop_codon:yes gene_type:complete